MKIAYRILRTTINLPLVKSSVFSYSGYATIGCSREHARFIALKLTARLFND